MQHAILLNSIREPDIQNNDRLRAPLNSTTISGLQKYVQSCMQPMDNTFAAIIVKFS